MLPHSFGHDVEALQSEGRGPVMGASASSNRTTAFDESSGILGFVSSRFRRSGRKKNKNKADNDPLPPSSAGNEVGVFVFHERDGESRGGGAVTCEHSGDSTDTTSTASSRHSSRQDRDRSPSRGTDARLAALADASHSMTTKREAAQQGGDNIATRHRGNAAAAAAVLQTGTGNVHVSPSSSSSSSSSASSGTEYAPPSSGGEEDDGRGQEKGGGSPDKQGQPPLPPHALDAAAPQPTKKEKGDESGKGDGHGGATSTRHVKGGMIGPSHSSPTDSSHSTTTSTSTTADSTSDTDDEDGDGEDDDGDSDDDRAYSKMTEQSEGPSSRVPFSNSGVHRHTIASPASANYYAPTRDVRSSLVSTIDVDVAVVRERRRQRQHHLYLQAALRQGSTAAGTAALPSTLTPAQSGFLRQRADAVYRRHMDALVEQYLSAPRYRTALAQFRKHLSAPEQEMRTAEAWGQYMRATQVSMPRPQEEEAGGESRGNKAAAAAAAAGREGDWWRVGSGNAGDGAAAAAAATAGGGSSSGAAAAVASVHSGADRYRIEKTDLELLVGDAARRARLLDDTLPWRPIDFDATGIRLEALEHLQADLGGTDAITGGSVAPAVGGSVNLLIEVLILTEMDVPFTSTIPMVNYTNVFLLLASLFVQSEVLLTKLIRLYRSVRAWEAEVEDTTRAVYLERRVLQCILVYCRVHEADLTLSCLQRLAVFVASEGFLGPVNVLNDAVGKEQWPCQEGVYCLARRRAAAYAHAMSTAAATSAAASPTSTSVPAFAGTRHYKRHGFLEPRRAVADGGVAGLFPQRTATFDPSAVLNPATRAPLQSEVAQTLLEFIVYLQRTIAVYYRAIEIAPRTRQALPFTPEGPLRMYVDTAVLRPGLGCTSTSLRTAMTADPRLSPEPFFSAESVGARFSERVPGSSSDRRPGSSGSPSRDHRFGGGGGENVMVSNRAYDGRQGEGYRGGSTTFGEAQQGRGLGGAGGPWANGPSPTPQPSTLETTVTQRPLSAVDIDAEHLARQICLLSFSLFTAVHIRELLNNAWTDTAMRGSVSRKLTELMEFSAHLQRWTAAVIVTPATWPECQRALRYFLEVCRMLYEQQNYEMAAAILEGLRHPSVEYLERVFAEARGQGLLSAVERRELETLMELMDPFASYSPSSLYSVTARTVGDMETPMIPLLAPILGVIFRSEEIKGATVSIRSSDGQAVVNWSKVTGLGKMVVLWMRCQYTPFAFPVDPEMQEFLWSTMNHQWTDALLMRAARRVKQ